MNAPINPFSFPAKGVQDPRLFVYREEVFGTIETALSDLEHGRSHGLLFVGERGSGKSSIFDYLRLTYCNPSKEHPQRRIMPVYIDAARVAVLGEEQGTSHLEPYGIFAEIFDRIRKTAIEEYGQYRLKRWWWRITDGISGVSTPWGTITPRDEGIARKAILKGRDTLSKHYRELKEGARLTGIIIMIDDADKLVFRVLAGLALIFHDLKGYAVFLAMGDEPEQTKQLTGDAVDLSGTIHEDRIPEVTDLRSGILANWERVPLGTLGVKEIRKMLERRLEDPTYQDWTIPEDDMQLILSLSGGNARLAIALANKSVHDGREQRGNKTLLHITDKVVNRTLESLDRFMRLKLEATKEITLARSRPDIRPRWW